MRIIGFVFLLYIFLICQAKAQGDDFRKVITKAFYDEQVYDKIFIEYKGDEGITFLEGYKHGMKGAFVLPDSNIQKHYPNILDVVGTGHATERNFMTMTLISHPSGNVFVTSNIMDHFIELLVNFDEFILSRKYARLVFHTTSLRARPNLENNYIAVECELKKRRRGWRVTRMKVQPQPCCSRLW